MEQAELLRLVVAVLEAEAVPYMVVGSLASAAYGEPRSTLDIDIVVQLSHPQVERILRAFPSEEFYLSAAAARQAVLSGGQFNLIHPVSGNKVDFMIARDDAWGRSQIGRRARRRLLPDLDAYVASPEDIVLGKLWYYQEGGSEKHLRDVGAMMQISGGEIDQSYIEHWVTQLKLGEPWQAVLQHKVLQRIK